MKYFRVPIAFFVIALVVLVGAHFEARSGRGQSQSPNAESRVKSTILITDSRESSSSKNATSNFAGAAAHNAVLQKELAWTFGGKQQHGWYLYNSLIGQILNTHKTGSSSSDFAAALADWQKKVGLNPSGVLDEDSLKSMITEWQSSRLKNRLYAQPDQLVTAPISDFYDPERLAELRQVERETYAAYKRMLAAAIADPSLNLAHTSNAELAVSEKYLKIVSAFRSREYQDQLRRQSPN